MGEGVGWALSSTVVVVEEVEVVVVDSCEVEERGAADMASGMGRGFRD